ncbi:MAG: amino acid decarboxylase, partial [Eubacterium sp.]|nr:amino acid decarboxylase [Eubacterium sp.]
YDFDPGKLIFYVGCNRGPWLFAKLRDEWNMELEMESRSYVLAMTSVTDEEKDFNALWEAVSSIDREITEGKKDGKAERIFLQNLPYPKRYKEPWEINSEEIYYASPEEAAGQLAASYIMLYPPGIPLLVPGEKIIKEMVENIEFYLYNGYNVQGLSHGRIPIVRGK